jgi:non-specific serine/threonine protein kinase
MNLEALRLSEELGNRRGVCLSLLNLALLATQAGDDEDALGYYRRALKLSRELANVHQTAVALAGLATLLALRQKKHAAVRIFGASEALLERAGGVLRPDVRETIGYERAVAATRDALGRKVFDSLWKYGRALDLDAALEFALSGELAVATNRAAPDDPLSRREREVAVMVGRGLTNREIARELGISKQTVDRHVGNILNKLGFDRRAQVATWIAEQRSGPHTTN